jgi:hypothetical protein
MSIVKENNYVCAYCGLGGYKIPSRLNKSGNNFCNRVCYGKYKDKRVEVECDYDGCGNKFLKREWEILNTKNNFCSEVCGGKFKDKKIEVECFHCHKKFLKHLYAIKNSKKHFCSDLCAKNLQKHKDWGGKRSKLEIAIEEHFKDIFPFIYIRYNKADIGYELDIYIPCLELAIELNGVFHYRVIYKKNGEERLRRTQEIDAEKVVECNRRDIKLFVIDVSRDGKSKKIQAQRISQVKGIVLDRIKELEYVFNNKQMIMEF